jgi:hypothetical protein
MGSVTFDAALKTADVYFQLHPEIDNESDSKLLSEILLKSLQNRDIPSRSILAKQLISWGADPSFIGSDEVNSVHVFVSRIEEPAVEAPLLQYLFDHGSDPNQYSPRYGTPLESLMYDPKFLEDELAPIYDIWFTCPNLEFFVPDRKGHDLFDKIRRFRGTNPKLLKRTEQYILDHGWTIPPDPRRNNQ